MINITTGSESSTVHPQGAMSREGWIGPAAVARRTLRCSAKEDVHPEKCEAITISSLFSYDRNWHWSPDDDGHTLKRKMICGGMKQ
jgi:hypothetical protein